MIEKIENPIAYAIAAWVSPDMGGRRSGPPSGPVYAATSVFVQNEDSQVHPEWPLGVDQMSILIEQSGVLPGGAWQCKIDFLARDLAEPFIHPGAAMLIMEGPKVVATAVITSVTDRQDA